jgi:hypothetical protein
VYRLEFFSLVCVLLQGAALNQVGALSLEAPLHWTVTVVGDTPKTIASLFDESLRRGRYTTLSSMTCDIKGNRAQGELGIKCDIQRRSGRS